MDPGAVPGSSTKPPLCGGLVGLNSFDKRNKGIVFARHDTAACHAAARKGEGGLDRVNRLNANDNQAFVAANDNTVVAVRAAA